MALLKPVLVFLPQLMSAGMPQSAAAAVAAAAVSAGGGPAGFIRTTLPSGGPNPLLPSSALPPVGPYFPKVS